MSVSSLHIVKRGRFFAVMECETLVCICVYKKGAIEVIRRLNAQIEYPCREPLDFQTRHELLSSKIQ
jgi:hypothetical protein